MKKNRANILRIDLLVGNTEFNHLFVNATSSSSNTLIDSSPNDEVRFTRNVASRKQVKRINEVHFRQVLDNVFRDKTSELYGRDFNQRKLNFRAEGKQFGPFGFKLLAKAKDRLFSEFTDEPFFKSVMKILTLLQSDPVVDKSSVVWTYGQTLVFVYAYEAFLFLRHLENLAFVSELVKAQINFGSVGDDAPILQELY